MGKDECADGVELVETVVPGDFVFCNVVGCKGADFGTTRLTTGVVGSFCVFAVVEERAAPSGTVSRDAAPRTGSVQTFEEETVSDPTGTEKRIVDTAGLTLLSSVEAGIEPTIKGAFLIETRGRILTTGLFFGGCFFPLPMLEEE